MISEMIKNIFTFHKRRYGWRRIQSELRDKGIAVGRHQMRSRRNRAWWLFNRATMARELHKRGVHISRSRAAGAR